MDCPGSLEGDRNFRFYQEVVRPLHFDKKMEWTDQLAQSTIWFQGFLEYVQNRQTQVTYNPPIEAT